MFFYCHDVCAQLVERILFVCTVYHCFQVHMINMWGSEAHIRYMFFNPPNHEKDTLILIWDDTDVQMRPLVAGTFCCLLDFFF